MPTIPRDQLDIGERQRKDRPANAVPDLRASILSKGLLHPLVVVRTDANRFRLIAGETRSLALSSIAKDNLIFNHDGRPILPGEVPVVVLDEDLSPADLLEAELEENIKRYNLSWQDQARAISAIHALRSTTNPGQSLRDTGRELAEKQGVVPTDGQIRWAGQTVRESMLIAEHLHKPSVALSRNKNEALATILRDEEAVLKAVLVTRRLAATPSTDAITVKLGSILDILPTLDGGQFDLIIADPPYGIGANKGGFRDRSAVHHNYDDTPEIAKDVLRCILIDGFRVCKPRANLFMFNDIDHFPEFKLLASSMGWVPFRTPFHWVKSESEGIRPWGGSGPARTVEWIFWATKGQKGLSLPVTDVFQIKRVARNERVYGPEKPIELMEKLIEISTMPGDFILDPCCGAGSSLAAARRLRRRALGIEISKDIYPYAVASAGGQEDEPELPLDVEKEA